MTGDDSGQHKVDEMPHRELVLLVLIGQKPPLLRTVSVCGCQHSLPILIAFPLLMPSKLDIQVQRIDKNQESVTFKQDLTEEQRVLLGCSGSVGAFELSPDWFPLCEFPDCSKS